MKISVSTVVRSDSKSSISKDANVRQNTRALVTYSLQERETTPFWHSVAGRSKKSEEGVDGLPNASNADDVYSLLLSS
jgi:hypothetical protein